MGASKQGEDGEGKPASAEQAALGELLQTEMRCPFGPRFFLEQLAAFVRESCPDPCEHLPRVDLWVHGEGITLCHILAIAPRWIAVAARSEREEGRMRTELIPYESIGRVTIGGGAPGARSMGFDSMRQPVVIDRAGMSPEEALSVAAHPPGSSPVRSPARRGSAPG